MTTIESRQNGTLKHLTRLVREKKYRQNAGEMLCEGEKMLEEALSSGARVKIVLVREGATVDTALLRRAEQTGAALFCAAPALFVQASDVETPQPVLFACEPRVFDADTLIGAKRVLVLDGLQDPGNLGTILRTADAFATDAVVLTPGCVDPCSPKVVRATMGAVFRLPVIRLPLAAAIARLHGEGLPVYAAALTDDALPVDRVPLIESAVIIGNEGRGVSEEALALSDRRVILPMQGCAESLNAGVAASIFLWEMAKRS